MYVPDRRGRGLSGPHGRFRGLPTEIEDLTALLDQCGASRIFGLSAGAVIAIEATRTRPDITRLALYEPPLSFDGVVHGEWAARFNGLLDAGRPGGALDFALIRTAGRPTDPGVMSPRELIPTVRYDAQTVNGAEGPLERFTDLQCEILRLGGTRSARNLTASLDGLARRSFHCEAGPGRSRPYGPRQQRPA